MAQNKAGLTPTQAGTCSACHMAHQFPRELVPGPGDPDGRCLSCHLAGRIAEDRVAAGAEHPDTRCTECHDPHDRDHRRFLVLPEADLCASCHPGQMSLRGGPHDITASAQSDHWHADARQQGGLCLSCHVPHGGERPDLFRVAAGAGVGNHDEVCLACHADTAWNAPEIGVIHPQHIAPDQHKVDLTLVPRDDSGELRMGCRTCHDPHGGAEPIHLARVQPGQPTEALCLHCHTEKQYIKFTGHASARLAELGMDTDSCKPCHAMHADRAGTWGNMLSTRFLPRCETAADRPDCVPCLSCHHENGPAPFQRVATHPRRMLAAVGQEADPGHLPLFNAAGLPDPQGEVVCRTCHVSHGRLDLLKVMAENPTWSAQQQDGLRAQLRPFIEPNTCSICHGPRARLLFLRFHDPAVRTQTHVPVR
jgi:predicted CXXCH cytochrome family protein